MDKNIGRVEVWQDRTGRWWWGTTVEDEAAKGPFRDRNDAFDDVHDVYEGKSLDAEDRAEPWNTEQEQLNYEGRR